MIPLTGADGKYHCKRCKKAFGKERHFLTHRCMATSDYVDISKRDVVKLEGLDKSHFLSQFYKNYKFLNIEKKSSLYVAS